MGKRLYIGNLSFQTGESELEGEFEKHGAVTSCDVITDRDTGRSRGFAFVEFAEDAHADAAQRALDGKDFDGHTLKVNEAHQREQQPRSNRY